jgi:hypothetical protein
MDTLPQSISKPLLDFCGKIAAGRPVFIPSLPIKGAMEAWCIRNSQEKVRQSGGKVAYGWAIWHLPGYFFEAEHHGVWCSPSGELIDVSPQFKNYPKILFLRDDTAVYDPKAFRANIIEPASTSPDAKEVVRLSRQRNEILNGYRTDEQVEIVLSAEDQAMIDDIDHRLGTLLS